MKKIYINLKAKFSVCFKVMMIVGMMGVGMKGWGQTATYTVASTTSVTTGGAAPAGSSATYSQTFATTSQITSGSNAILTLSGYAGYKITGIVLSMKSNASGGAGNMNAVAGSTTVSSIATNTFLNAAWNGAYSTTYVNITPTVSAYNIVTGNNVVITINATANSLYIQSYTITYTTVCTPPAQASSLTTSMPTTDGFSANWTAGGGNGSMLVVRPTAQPITTPVVGTSYAANTVWASAGQIDANNRVVFRAAGATVGPLTGLTAGTQYTATAYEYNTAGNCYNLTSPVSASIYTLSTEPTAHAASFTCNASAYNQIDLSFPAASAAAGNGYIILQKTGSAPTGTPTDATAYTVGNTIGDATVAAIVNTASATSQAITSLLGSTNYFYTLIPFNWNGTNAATYNYRTVASIPSSNCTTPAAPSLLSDITTDATFGYTSNINYTTWQAATITNAASSVGVHNIIVRDGGATAPDVDALPTILNAITFNYSGAANTIKSAALFSTTNALLSSSITAGANSITFTGLNAANFTVADNGTLQLILRVTFNNAVTDNDKLIFTVASATTASAATSSQFATANAGAAVSDNNNANDRNRIEVTADRLAFVQQPSGATNGIAMSPSITVKAVDVNANTDVDFVSAITLTCSTPAALTSGGTSTAVTGLSTFSTVIHTTDGTYTMIASATGLTSTSNSSSYIISSVVNGTWRTTSGSPTALWASTAANSTVTWERMVSGSWVAQALPTQPPTSGNANTVIIMHQVTLQGTNTHKDIIIANGGILNTSTVTATFGSLLVQTGGIFNRQGSVTFDVTGTLEVEDGATFTFKQTNQNPRTSGIWAGTEKFHKNSNFEVVFSDNVTLTILEGVNDVLPYTDGTSTACFGNVIINCSSGSMQLIPSGFGTPGSPKQLTHQDLIFRANSDNKFAQGAFNVIIGRDLIVESGYNQTLTLATTAVTATMSVMGNLTNSSTLAFRLVNNAAGNVTLNVDGNISLNSTSSLDLNFAIGGVSAINLKGDLTVASGALLFATATTVANNVFNFSGTGDGSTAAATQTIDIATVNSIATRNQYIDFNVSIGAYVQLINQNFELGKSSTITVKGLLAAGGTLDFNFNGATALNITSYSTGTKFKTEQAATLKITSPNGISATSGTIGNVQVTNAPTYDGVGTFWYLGKVDQITGNGLPYASSAKIIYVKLLDNTKTLTLTPISPQTTIGISIGTALTPLGGRLEIQKGIVLGTATGDFTGSGRLVMTDGEYRINTITTTPLTDYLPQLSNYNNYSLTGGTVHLNGVNATQIISGTPNYYNLSFSGSNTLGTNYKGLSNATSVSNNISISETAIVDVKDRTLGSNATNFSMADNSRYITNGGGTKPDAGGTYLLGANTTIDFGCTSGAGVVRLGTPIISYANVIVSGTKVSNTSTATGIQFQTGGTFVVKNGANFNLANTAGFSGTTATAISNLNSPAITLESGSTINYNGAAQTITNATLSSPASANYYNLTLSGTGAKTAPSSNLTISGDLFREAGAHTFEANTGRVIFNGALAQKYYGTATNVIDFYNCTNNNTSATGLSIDANMGVLNELKLNTTNKIYLNTGDIIMRSSATRTSYIADLNVTGVGNTASNIAYNNGLFSVERYLQPYKAWRFIATPFEADATLTVKNSWQETGAATVGYGTQVTGPAGVPAGFDQASPRGSLKYFEGSGSPDGGFVEISNTNTAPLINKEGYFVFVRGDRTVANGGTTGATNMRIRGKILTGDQTYTVGASRFLSIGNPYASQIDFKQATAVLPSGLEGSYTVWNPNPVGTAYNAGKYEQRVRQIGGDYTYLGVPQNFIESGQGFLIQGSNGGGGSITLKESYKTTGSNLASRGGEQGRAGVTLPTLEINLFTKDAVGTFIKVDAAFQNYDEGFNGGIDNNDVRKVMNVSDNISIATSTYTLIAERRKPLSSSDTIFMHLSNVRETSYQFLIDPSVLGNLGLEAFLQDKFLQTSTTVSLTDSTLINFTVTNEAASKASNRFMIVFKSTAIAAFTTIKAKRNVDKTITINWGITNEKNIQNYEVEQSNDGINFTTLITETGIANSGTNTTYTKIDATASKENNWYRIKMNNINSTIKYSSIAMVAAEKEIDNYVKPNITIEPNIIVDYYIPLHFQNITKGMYVINIYNTQGQMVKTFNVALKNNNQKMVLPINTLAKGKYYVKVYDEMGTATSIDFIVQ
jgi:hypothetical protein